MLLLATWVLVCALVAIPAAAAHGWLVRRGVGDERVRLTAPLVFVGGLGYVAFFAFLAHPVVGQVFSFSAVLGLGAYAVHCRRSPPFATRPALPLPALLGFAIGLFYLALLYLPALGRDAEWQSQVRFLYEFPIDANLPKMLGDRLYTGESPRPFLPELGWLASDRPPLQAGLYLFVRPWLDLVRVPAGLTYQCIGTLAQLLWLPAAWLVCRVLGLGRLRSTLVVLLAAASGFLLFNSTYVWPKLLAGGFILLAAVLWLDRSTPRTPAVHALAAAAAALGWLAHGSAGFSLVTLGLVLLLPCYFPGWRNCALAALVFGLGALPWTVYQKFYDPPANRLMKWHLAGVVPIDPRTAWEAIGDSYAGLPRGTLVANKRANLGMVLGGSFGDVFNLFTPSLQERKVDEFFHVFRSLGILNLAWVLAPLVWLGRRRLPPAFELQGMLLAWTVLTLVFWALAMFTPASTILHQGSYAMMLSLFVLAIIFAIGLPRWIAALVLGWHVIEFAVTWLPYTRSAPLRPGMMLLLALSAALIGLALWLARAAGTESAREPPMNATRR